MKTKLMVFLLLFSKVVSSQNANDRTMYMEESWKEGTKDKYTYLRIIKDYYLDQSEYRFEDYYKNGRLQMEGNSIDKDYLTKNGLFKYYYENGNKKSEVTYTDNTPKGNRTQWYENGVKKMESEYIVVEGEVEPQYKINQYWNSEGKQQVVDGNGFIDDSYEKGSSKGNLVNGLKNGVWEGKDTEYNFSYTETYDHGKLISGKSIDENNEEHSYNIIKLEPRPRKGISHFYKYIGERFSIPRGAESIYGKMQFTFAIGKDGDASDFMVVKSLGSKMDNEGIRVIKKYPDWASGELRGIKVSFQYSIPIVIKEQ
jgi:antitoxin component YwqK of YwqJK toxin-antitoxin module